MDAAKVAGALVMPWSQPCVHKVTGHSDEGERPHAWGKDAENAFIFYLRSEIPALDGGFDIYADTHLWAVRRSVLIASSIALHHMV